MKTVSILGCGWLGKSLAKTLIAQGYSVKGSVTSPQKHAELQSIGIEPFTIELNNSGILGDIASFMANTQLLIIAIPPGIRRNPKANYKARIQHLASHISSYPNCKVLHLSSIGVFGASQGKVDEIHEPKPKTEVGKQLLLAEHTIMALKTATSIVRLGGLVGPNRHPVKQLSGKTEIPAPLAPTNLVHQKDVIDFLNAILNHNLWGHIFHCVSPVHHQRKEFYTNECLTHGLPLPHFSNAESNRTKIILDTKSAALFEFEYQLAACSFKDC